MSFFHTIEQFIVHFSAVVPLPLFVFLGSFLEEVISPIPSALVMGTAGTLAMVNGKVFWYLFLLATIGNIGKTSGAFIYYFIGDKLEDVFVKPLSRYFNINHQSIENIGKRFTGHHWKDGGILFLIRLFPPFPTTPVSLACGAIKMDKRVFLLATYAGNFLKDLVYLYIGYVGFASFHSLWHQTNKVKFGVDIFVTVAVISVVAFFFFHNKKGKERVKQYTKKMLAYVHYLRKK